eukprot:tig00000955_g5806.t1
MHVRRLGPEDADGIGCLPRTTSTVFVYSKSRPEERGCLKKEGAGSFLLETHDVFVASDLVLFFTGETFNATPWRGVEDIFRNTETAKAAARPRNVMRIHRGKLAFADAASLYQGYLPSTPELCHFTIEPWTPVELTENPGTDDEAGKWRAEMAFGYQFPNPIAVSQRTCSRDGVEFLAVGAVYTFDGFQDHMLKTLTVILIPMSVLKDASKSAADVLASKQQRDQAGEIQDLQHGIMSLWLGITDIDVADNCSWIGGVFQVHGPGHSYQPFSLFGDISPAVSYHFFRDDLRWTSGALEESVLRIYGDVARELEPLEQNFASLTCWDPSGSNAWRAKTQLFNSAPCVFTKRTNPDFLNEDVNNVKAADPDLVLIGIAKDAHDVNVNTNSDGSFSSGYGALLLRKAMHKYSGVCIRQQLVFMPFIEYPYNELPKVLPGHGYRTIAELDCGVDYTGSRFDLRRKAMSISIIGSGPFVAVGASAGAIQFYDLRAPQDLLTTKMAEVVSLSGGVRTVRHMQLASGPLLVAADDAGNFAQLALKSVATGTPLRKKGPSVLDAELSNGGDASFLDPAPAAWSWIEKMDAPSATRDSLGPNRALFLRSPTMCHVLVAGQERAAYWGVDEAPSGDVSAYRWDRTQATQVIRPTGLKTLQHTLGNDGSRRATSVDGALCSDCNDGSKNYRFFGVHPPTGDLLALSATGGTLFAGDGRCVDNQPSRIAPAKTWTWRTDAAAVPWTADASGPYDVTFSEAFAPFMGAAEAAPTGGFDRILGRKDTSNPELSFGLEATDGPTDAGGRFRLPAQYFPSAQEHVEPLAFHGSAWAAMAGVVYPLEQARTAHTRGRSDVLL